MSRSGLRSMALLSAFVLTTFAAFVAVRHGQLREPVESEPAELLIVALGSFRPIEARIHRLPHLAYDSPNRSSVSSSASWRLMSAAAEVRERAAGVDSPALQHALALSHLFLGENEEAIRLLQTTLTSAPNQWAIRIDLAAALHERWRNGGDLRDLFEAYEQLARVLVDEPVSHEASFNRALVLEAMDQPSMAMEAWHHYLDLDSTSGWAIEARERIKRLETEGRGESWDAKKEAALLDAARRGETITLESLVRGWHHAVRLVVEDQLLPQWATLLRRGEGAAAEERLASAEVIAASLAAVSGEWLAADAVDEIRRTPSRAASLAEAHEAYGRARESFQQYRIDLARPQFENALTLFERSGSPFALNAVVGLAGCDFYHSDYASVLARVADLDRALGARQERYQVVRARADWLAGLVQLSRGYPDESHRRRLASLQRFEKLGDRENSAALHVMLSEHFEHVGAEEEAARHRSRAFELVAAVGSQRWELPLLVDAAEAAQRKGQFSTATLFLTRNIELAETPYAIADALVWRAWSWQMGGLPERARDDLNAARRQIAQVDDELLRHRLRADGDLVSAFVLRETDPEAALEALDSAEGFYRGGDDHLRLATIQLERGRIERSRERREEAISSFVAGIEYLEKLRERVEDPRFRTSSFGMSEELFDELIDLLAGMGRMDEAFRFAERGRARTLLEVSAGDGWSVMPLESSAIIRTLPPDVTLVMYAYAGHRLTGWIVRQDGMSWFRRERVEQDRLVAAIDTIRTAADGLEKSAELFELLVGPAVERTPPGSMLVFIPDEQLHRVPFAALRDPRTGRHLIEDYAIMFAPSATFFVGNRKRPRESTPRAVLAVGDPAFDRERFPHLARLPEAAREARQVVGFYDGSELLEGPAAQKRRFLELAPRFDWIHFAGHAVADRRRPELSHLLLAPSGDDRGALYAHEIAGKRLDKASLVVLSACSTAAGTVEPAEGEASLARAFLSAGASAVVGTLWPVDDAISSELLVRFHGSARGGASPADALRQAQLSMLAAGGRLAAPSSWSGYQLLGTIQGK